MDTTQLSRIARLRLLALIAKYLELRERVNCSIELERAAEIVVEGWQDLVKSLKEGSYEEMASWWQFVLASPKEMYDFISQNGAEIAAMSNDELIELINAITEEAVEKGFKPVRKVGDLVIVRVDKIHPVYYERMQLNLPVRIVSLDRERRSGYEVELPEGAELSSPNNTYFFHEEQLDFWYRRA